MKNDTGGAAVFSLILKPNAAVTAAGGSLTDPTISVATGKTHVMQLTDLFKQSDDDVYIDCDVAGKVLVLDL